MIGFWAVSIGYAIMVIGGITGLIFANQMLSKPGISANVRGLVLKRHAAGILIFISTNLYIMIFLIWVISINGDIPNPTNSWWRIILKIFYFSEGVLSPLIRLNEPAFRIACT